jgi:oligoribonuclease (3'-5' exoribonuclease)
MFQQFHDWMGDGDKNTFLWGNGILFDNNFIRDKFTSFGMSYPIYYRNDRDVRTILELAVIKSGMSESEFREKFVSENKELHNALNDVLYQVEMVHQCYKIIME